MLHVKGSNDSIAVHQLEGKSASSNGGSGHVDSSDHQLAELLFSNDEHFATYMHSLPKTESESPISIEDIERLFHNGPKALSPERMSQLLTSDPGALALLREKLHYIGRELPPSWVQEVISLVGASRVQRAG